MSILIIGYGNPGRQDDGLGPAFAERVQALSLPGVTVEADYQLAVEHAAELARHDAVLFADASSDAEEPFSLHAVKAERNGVGFTSHSLSVPTLLGLADALFGVRPRAFQLAIRGFAFDGFGEGLSPRAAANLDAAVEQIASQLRNGRIVA